MQPPVNLRDTVVQALPTLAPVWHALQGGRVNSSWRAGDVVIKHFAPTGASPLFPNDAAAEARALSLLGPLAISPLLLAHGPDWVAYRHIPGTVWQSDPTLVATALTRLHHVPAPAHKFRPSANGSVALLEQAKSIAQLCTTALPPPPQDPGVGAGQTSLIHGDAVPGNLIAHQGRITLIDWQCPAIGDPTEDIAAFLSPAMQWLYRGTPLSEQELSTFRAACLPAVINRYDQLAKLYHWRMAAHCLWKAERGEADYATALQLELAALECMT